MDDRRSFHSTYTEYRKLLSDYNREKNTYQQAQTNPLDVLNKSTSQSKLSDYEKRLGPLRARLNILGVAREDGTYVPKVFDYELPASITSLLNSSEVAELSQEQGNRYLQSK